MGEYADMAIEQGLEEWWDAGCPPISRRRPRFPLPDDPTKEWIAADGKFYQIAEMTHAHLANTILKLEAKGTKMETTKLIFVGHPCYPYLVREAIKRNLLNNPHNGIDINIPVKKNQQVAGKITTMLVQEGDRKVDFDL